MLCDHVHRRVLQLVSLLGWTGAAVLNFQVSDLLTTSPTTRTVGGLTASLSG